MTWEDFTHLIEEFGEELRDELEFNNKWKELADEFTGGSRWCNHYRKIFRHESGLTVAVEYASNVGDGESASSYNDEWYEVEAYKETVTKYRKKE